MLYANYIDYNGEERSVLYDTWEQYFNDTFSPETKLLSLIEFKVTGKGYKNQKASVEDIAIRFSHECACGLSWYEMARITEWFSRMGRRYGLTAEFTENAICCFS